MQLIKISDEAKQCLANLAMSFRNVSKMTISEQEFLTELIIQYRPKKVLEVGVAAGASSVVMMNALETASKDYEFYSVDLVEQYYREPNKKTGYVVEEYKEFVEKRKLFTGGFVGKFLDEIGDGIDFCLIDTAHRIPGEILDFLMILPYLTKDAVVVLHDTSLHTWDNASCTANALLMSAISGEKLLKKQYGEVFFHPVIERSVRMPFPNIGAVKLDGTQHEKIWDIFNLLIQNWFYELHPTDYKILKNCLAKHYDEYYLQFLDHIYEYQNSIYEKSFIEDPDEDENKIYKQIDEQGRTKIPVVFAANNHYAMYLSVLISSIVVKSNKDKEYELIILETEISKEYKDKLKSIVCHHDNISMRFINLSEEIAQYSFHVNKWFSVEMYFRLYMPNLLKHYSKAIYLDVDTVVCEDIANLFEIDLEDYAIGATVNLSSISHFNNDKKWRDYYVDILKINDPYKYLQSGVLLMNLEKMRENNDQENLLDLALSSKFSYPDQDTLNYYYNGRIKFIDQAWNMECFMHMWDDKHLLKHFDNNQSMVNSFKYARENVKLIHYDGPNKPWNSHSVGFDAHWWALVKYSPFEREIKFDRAVGQVTSIMDNILDLQRKNNEIMEKIQTEAEVQPVVIPEPVSCYSRVRGLIHHSVLRIMPDGKIRTCMFTVFRKVENVLRKIKHTVLGK